MEWASHCYTAKASRYGLNIIVGSTYIPDSKPTTTSNSIRGQYARVGRIETEHSQCGCRETEFGQRELFHTNLGDREQRDMLEYISAIINISSKEISGQSRRIRGLLQHDGDTGSRRKEPADRVTFTSTTVVTIITTISKHPASRPAKAMSGGEGGEPSCSNGSCWPDDRRSSSSPAILKLEVG